MNTNDNFEDLISKAVTHLEREHKLKRIQQIRTRNKTKQLIFRKFLPWTGIAAACILGFCFFYFQWMQAGESNVLIQSESILSDNSGQNDSSNRIQSITKHAPNQIQKTINEKNSDSFNIISLEISNQSVSSVIQGENDIAYSKNEQTELDRPGNSQAGKNPHEPINNSDRTIILTNPNQANNHSKQKNATFENKLYKLNNTIKVDSFNVKVIIKSGLQNSYSISNDTLVLSFVGDDQLKRIINCFDKHHGNLITWIDKQELITIDTRDCFHKFTNLKKH
ncbi:MAG: hypothetical protein IPK91_06010 [Saprospiraceae bacterium]|nr:hypothetical protein [Saprospiraceae bacterium]MBK8296825.1 hypothetical protein [Saprospiraceae bacterium]